MEGTIKWNGNWMEIGKWAQFKGREAGEREGQIIFCCCCCWVVVIISKNADYSGGGKRGRKEFI
jgi:hypothetical protein